MSLYRLDRNFAPSVVAIVGASDRPQSLGQAVLASMRRAGFSGDLYPVNPRHAEVGGLPAYASLAALPKPPDLVVLAAPARTLPGLVQ